MSYHETNPTIAHNLGQSFVYRFQPNSVTVLRSGTGSIKSAGEARLTSTHFNLKARTGVLSETMVGLPNAGLLLSAKPTNIIEMQA